MKRIILHWTAGGYKANLIDRLHYHYCVEGDGTVVPCVPISRNEPPLKPGYAQHTLNCNSSSIGIAVCCAAGAVPGNMGKYPPTPAQLQAFVQLAAKLSVQYNIPIGRQHILTHGEVQANLGIRQRGKWDLQVPGGEWLRYAISKARSG